MVRYVSFWIFLKTRCRAGCSALRPHNTEGAYGFLRHFRLSTNGFSGFEADGSFPQNCPVLGRDPDKREFIDRNVSLFEGYFDRLNLFSLVIPLGLNLPQRVG